MHETALAASPRKFSLSPRDHATVAVRAALGAGVAALRERQAACVAGEIEPIHQFRVAARRLRAAVELFSSVIHGGRLKLYRRELAWLMHAASGARECDVTDQLLHARATKLEPALADVMAPVYTALAERRNVEHQVFVTALNSHRFEQLLVRLEMPVTRKFPPAATLCAHAPAMARALARGITRAGAKLTAASPPTVFHRLRIRMKRMRYALDLLAEFGGKKRRKLMARLTAMQDLLGFYNDAVASGRWLRDYAATAALSAPSLLAVGAMMQSLAKRERKLAARCLKRWKRFDRSGIMRETLAELAHKAREQTRAQLETVNAA